MKTFLALQNSKIMAKGFSITEIMIAIGLFALLSVGLISFMLNVQSEIQGENVRTAIYMARNSVLGNLRAPASWQETVAKNPSLLCFAQPQQTCTSTNPEGYAPLALYDASGTLVVGEASVGPGWTYQGVPCAGADPTNGNDSCPIGIELKWKRLCSNQNCDHPVAQVVANFFHRPKISANKVHLNKKALAVNLEIPKLVNTTLASTDLLNHSRSVPKLFSNRTAYSRRLHDPPSSYITRDWENGCYIYAYRRTVDVEIPAASTLITTATNWVLIWGAKGTPFEALLPTTYRIVSPNELEMYIDQDTQPCASDSSDGLGLHGNYLFSFPGGTSGGENTITCARYFDSPRQVQIRLLVRVTSCVSNPAIDPDPDFRIVRLNSILIR